ncbi:MAG: metallophosphoesterase [Desulfobacterales bacterium]|nr:metallophosphoesterase [Desulfobacterales bacterium]
MIHLSIACSAKQPFLFQNDPDALALSQTRIPFPDTRFFVISDTHLYDAGLGTTGEAFQEYLDNDRKLLELSDEIINTAIEEIAGQDGDFVLVCGDLTKDGEIICHRGMAGHLSRLKASGKKVFVAPGNHDVANPAAVRFSGAGTEPVPTVGPEAFKQIYQDYGYGQALVQDEHSLSYVAEPVEGLWLLALDSCRWQENVPGHHPITSGAFSRHTLDWIEQQLIAAKRAGKAVMVMQHHGIMEHYPANEKFYDEYIIKDHDQFTELLAAYKVPLAFTGHFHAQDITLKKAGEQVIFDIETGSLVTAPCPFRQVEFKDGNTAVVKSTTVRSIPSMGDAFAAHAEAYVVEGTKKMANTALAKYKVSQEQSDLINHQVARAYLAHLKGNEVMPATPLDTAGFNPWLRFVSWMQEDLIHGWWSDLPPEDNNLTIDLDTGEVSKA